MLFHVEKYAISPRTVTIGTMGSYGFETVELELSAAYDDLEIRLCFYPPSCGDGEGVTLFYTRGSSVPIPAEVTKTSGYAAMIVVGRRDGATIISQTAQLFVEHTHKPADAAANMPAPDQYAALQAAVDALRGMGGVKGDKGEKGDMGPQGQKGEKGDAYVLTDADRQAIATLAADGAAGIPSYVRTEVEAAAARVCSVTGAVAEDTGGSSAAAVNVLPLAEDTDGSLYGGGKGYTKGSRIASDGSLAGIGWSYVTGYISVKNGDVILLQHVTMNETSANVSNMRISFYNAAKQQVFQAAAHSEHFRTLMRRTVDELGNIQGWTAAAVSDADTIAYMRFNCEGFDETSIVTVGEAPTAASVFPVFHFAFLTDMHCGYYSDPTHMAVSDAGRALSVLQETAHLDAIIFGGDYAVGGMSSTAAQTKTEIYAAKSRLKPHIGDAAALWLKGNHDDVPYQATAQRLTKFDLMTLFGNENFRNPGLVTDAENPAGLYGYLDFPVHRIRIIYLNTDDKDNFVSETAASSADVAYLNAHHVGDRQLAWLADTALDFSDKQNPAEWSFLVVSHVPLHVSGSYHRGGQTISYSTAAAAAVLRAYTGEAKFLCSVYGHEHALVHTVIAGRPAIGCPNVLYGREKASSDGNIYEKTPGTGDSTAFCIFSVDRNHKKIHVFCYGAGFDRTFTIG